MGLAQDLHAAVCRYEDGARGVVLAAQDLAVTVDALADRLAANGPLGVSADPDLARARACIAIARQKVRAAVEGAEASRGTARAYADRAMPL